MSFFHFLILTALQINHALHQPRTNVFECSDASTRTIRHVFFYFLILTALQINHALHQPRTNVFECSDAPTGENSTCVYGLTAGFLARSSGTAIKTRMMWNENVYSVCSKAVKLNRKLGKANYLCFFFVSRFWKETLRRPLKHTRCCMKCPRDIHSYQK